jgi:hypothetical protein
LDADAATTAARPVAGLVSLASGLWLLAGLLAAGLTVDFGAAFGAVFGAAGLAVGFEGNLAAGFAGLLVAARPAGLAPLGRAVLAALAGAFGLAADFAAALPDVPLPAAALLRAGAFLAGLLVTSTSLLAGNGYTRFRCAAV